MVQSEKPKEEITLEDEEPRLVKLLIDYFYQLDYDDSPQVEEATTPTERPINGMKSPESPVGRNVDFYESLARTEDSAAGALAEDTPAEEPIPEPSAFDEPAIATVDDSLWGFGSRRKHKKKRKSSSAWESYPPPEPAEGSKSSAVSEAEVPRLHFDKSDDDDLNNTELAINALMYALADKYG